MIGKGSEENRIFRSSRKFNIVLLIKLYYDEEKILYDIWANGYGNSS